MGRAMTLKEKLDLNQNIKIIDGKEYIVCNDELVLTDRTQEEIEEEYKILKEASDQLTDWIPG